MILSEKTVRSATSVAPSHAPTLSLTIPIWGVRTRFAERRFQGGEVLTRLLLQSSVWRQEVGATHHAEKPRLGSSVQVRTKRQERRSVNSQAPLSFTT
jgi:hypothetical protein